MKISGFKHAIAREDNGTSCLEEVCMGGIGA